MSANLSNILGLCFDIDGTLRDTDDEFVQRIAILIRPLRYLLPRYDEHFIARKLVMAMENPGTYLQGLTDRLDIDAFLVQLSERLLRLRKNRKLSNVPLIGGVPEMLATLARRYPMAVVSARSERFTLEFLDEHNLRPFFCCVVAGQTCRHTKPYPDPVIYAAKNMDISPQRCLMVGDTTADIRAGRLAGAKTAGVLCGFGEEPELTRDGADLILQTTHLLLHYLPE